MKSGCDIWEGTKWSQGRYGLDYLDGKAIGAHRAAWIRINGKIPKGMVVCHRCDNGLCVNVDHLFLGTLSDNMRDCRDKGRLYVSAQKGSLNRNAKCDVEARNLSLKKDRVEGMSLSKLREKYGLKSNGHLLNMLRS